jgi:hypothetical protein
MQFIRFSIAQRFARESTQDEKKERLMAAWLPESPAQTAVHTRDSESRL